MERTGKEGRLAGKTAMITGGASGFGREMAERFAAEGARVALLDLNREGAEAVAAGIGDAAMALGCDVADGPAVRQSLAAVVDAFGRLDVAVNNAGWSHMNRPLMEVTEEDFDRVFAINVKSIYHVTHALVPHWRAQGGGVMLNIGSTAGIRPRPGLTWYNASKGAVNLVSRSLAAELAPDKVRVNCIAPVMGATALLETFMGMEDTPENRAKFTATVPLGRLSEPEDIANAALYLCSDEAAFVTGVVLEVDGGRTI
ncbi:MAG: glucose 1-dehydrogenase [Pseudomonadota bacterium]